MHTPPIPSVDMRAPDGGRIVLQPVLSLTCVPGIGRGTLAAVVVLCTIWLATSFHRLGHTDLWGHLSFGRWIVENGTLPESDPFRTQADTLPVPNVAWLGQAVGYGWYRMLGHEGLVLGHTLLVALTAAGLMAAVRGRGVGMAWAAAAAASAYVLAIPITGTIRPQLFGMVGFAAVLWAISRLGVRRHPLLWLPGLFVLWANLHGSFAVGLAVLGCYALGETWEVRRGQGLRAVWTARPVRRAWLALLLAVGASCLNPAGVKLLAVVAGFSGNTTLTGISEWRALTLGSLSGSLFFASVLITAALLRLSPRRIRAVELLLVLMFAVGTLTAIRMLVWWALAWSWAVAPHAAAVWQRWHGNRGGDANRGGWGKAQRCPRCIVPGASLRSATSHPATSHPTPSHPSEKSEESQQHEREAASKRTLFAAAVIVGALFWAPPSFGLISGEPRPVESILAADTPHGLAREMARRQLAGRALSPMDWGDYLLWRSGGAVEPLVYSHVHLTGPQLWHDFQQIRGGSAGWLALADSYGLKYLAVDRRRQHRLAAAAAAEPRCRLLYRDGQSLLIEIVACIAE